MEAEKWQDSLEYKYKTGNCQQKGKNIENNKIRLSKMTVINTNISDVEVKLNLNIKQYLNSNTKGQGRE